MPDTTPLTRPPVVTLAVAGSELLHVPPVVTSASSDVLPVQIDGLPVIGAGAAVTVITCVCVQPEPKE